MFQTLTFLPDKNATEEGCGSANRWNGAQEMPNDGTPTSKCLLHRIAGPHMHAHALIDVFRGESVCRRLRWLTLVALCFFLGHVPTQAEILLGQDLSTGKNLRNLQVDSQWRVSYTLHNSRDLQTKVLSAPQFPFGKHWIPPTSSSNWLTPDLPAFSQKNAPSGMTGLYQTYYVRFWLTPNEANTAYIGGLNGETARWTSDNNGFRILLNHKAVWNGNTRPQAYRQWHSVKPITTGFRVGWNTLEFVIRNNPVLSRNTEIGLKHHCKTIPIENPTAFRFEAGLYYDPGPPAAIPEPSSIVLCVIGCGSVGLASYRRKLKKVV